MKKQSDLNNIEITLNSKNYEEWKNKIKAKGFFFFFFFFFSYFFFFFFFYHILFLYNI